MSPFSDRFIDGFLRWLNTGLLGAAVAMLVVAGLIIASPLAPITQNLVVESPLRPSGGVLDPHTAGAAIEIEHIQLLELSGHAIIASDFVDRLLVAAALLPKIAIVLFILQMVRHILHALNAGTLLTHATAQCLTWIGLSLAVGWQIAIIIGRHITDVRLDRMHLSTFKDPTFAPADVLWPLAFGVLVLVFAGMISAAARREPVGPRSGRDDEPGSNEVARA